MNKINYVRFDWAIKKLLRDKANFEILEVFIEVFLGKKNAKFLKFLKMKAITRLKMTNSIALTSKQNLLKERFLLLKSN